MEGPTEEHKARFMFRFRQHSVIRRKDLENMKKELLAHWDGRFHSAIERYYLVLKDIAIDTDEPVFEQGLWPSPENMEYEVIRRPTPDEHFDIKV